MSETTEYPPLIPVILSGGAGTRLWPVSRRAHPKPFMQLTDGESLAEKTWLRAQDIAGGAPVLTVTSRDYYFYTRDLYARIGAEQSKALFLLEPLVLHRKFREMATANSDRAFRRAHVMHWFLLGLSLVAVLGTVAGVHGVHLF